MTKMSLNSFACGAWIEPSGTLATISSAVTGAIIGEAGSGALKFDDMIAYAKERVLQP